VFGFEIVDLLFIPAQYVECMGDLVFDGWGRHTGAPSAENAAWVG
jgi:hypothetical protein